MSNVAKLKKEAADLEQKKQFDKALKVYEKLFAEFEKHPQEVDVAMYNRVGDIQLKLGQVAEAVDTYEKGVDYYAEGGFFNNAIALGNKILRQAPGRASIYYKLGKINAQKGFKAEARQNYLEYADRMQKSGNTTEAFRALIEFMDLVPDQDDIRAMLADQLIKADRKPDAVVQLQRLYERHMTEGRGPEADAVGAKVQALDPSVDLSSINFSSHESSGGDLVFLDLDAPIPARSSGPPASPPPPPVRPVPAAKAPPPPPPPPPVVDEMIVTRASDQAVDASSATIDAGMIIEPTNLGTDAVSADLGGGLEIEPTSFGELAVEPELRASEPIAAMETRPSEPIETVEVRQSEPIERMDVRLSEPIITAPIEAPEFEPMSFEMPSALSPQFEPEPVAEIEKEDEPQLLDIGSLPESAIAPTIDDAPMAVSMDLVDLEPIADEPPPPPPPAPPAPKPAATKPAGAPLNPFAARAAATAAEKSWPTPKKAAPVPPPAPPSPPKPPAKPARPAKPAAPAILDLDLADDAMPRKSTVFAAKAVNILQAAVSGAPEDWSLRRELAEAMLEAGDRAGGLHELEVAMNGAENSDDLELAMALAEELGKLEPLTVKHHQKRVEYAFRRNDKPRLVEAYLTLGDALMQNTQLEKARAVYQRVLELAPDNLQAQTAMETLAPLAVAVAGADYAEQYDHSAHEFRALENDEKDSVRTSEDGFVNLGDWLREDEAPKDTRMVVDEKEPTGDEDADFADMLKKFKQGVAENVDAEDYQSHYDLAIAFKEMGLLDEAIAGFQRALGSKQNRLPTYEALGECFLEKGQAKMGAAILNRALNESSGATDDQLVGVLYLLGRAAENQGQSAQALEFYQRVFVIDIQFKDVVDRMTGLEKAAR